MGYRLGIDLGTTFTAAAYVEDEQPRMVELGYRHVSVPSVLLVGDDGDMLVGEAAERRAQAEPERVVREFKRRLGDDVPLVVAGRTFAPLELQTTLLRWVLDYVAQRLAPPLEQLVVTHPADWGPYKLQLTRDLIVAAGVPDAVLCPEPVAAAIEFAAKRSVPVGARVAVYDLGGGTFDVAVLEKTTTGFTILGTPQGIQHLGGSDFDDLVFTQTLSRLGVEDLDIGDPDVARALTALRRECIEAKEALSTDVSTEISSLLPGATRRVRLTRSELESLIRPSLEESIESTRRALRLAGVEPGQLHSIVLVGGSSRIPLVTELLTSELGAPVVLDTYPKNDIAMGAARFAQSLGSPSDDQGTPSATPPADEQGPAGDPTDTAGADGEVSAAEQSDAGKARVGQTRADRSEAAAPHRRRALLIGAGAAAVLLAVVAGGYAINRLRSPSQSGGTANLTATSTSTPSTSAGAGSSGPAVVSDLPVGPAIPDRDLLAPRTIASGAISRLWLVDTEQARRSRQLDASAAGNIFSIGLSKDRRTIVYVDGGTNAVFAMPASGGQARRLFASPEGCGKIRHASWSGTDPSVFVLECQPGDQGRRLVVASVAGLITRELSTGQVESADPTISPDGTQVAFWGSGPEGDADSLLVMPIDGSGPARVVATDAAGDPAWSPDGGSIAFRRAIGAGGSQSDLLVVPAAGGTIRTLVTGSADDEKPAWSPDGGSIAFVSNRNSAGHATSRRDIWVVPAAGGKPAALGLTTHEISTPTWSRR